MLTIDTLYLYKIQSFTGFAPCFDHNRMSLVCCMGNRTNGGMRASIGKKYEEKGNVWILAIAGEKITLPKQNDSHIPFKAGDLVYLAKVTDVCSLKDYGDKYTLNGKPYRNDAIYYYCEETKSLKQIENEFHNLSNMPTDTASDYKDHPFLKQATLSDEYYVFKEGVKISEYSVKRGFKYKKVSGLHVAQFMDSNPSSYTINTNPFQHNLHLG